MSPTESVSSVFRNYINFKGRAQRSEFWWFTLFSFIVSVGLGIIGTALPALNFLEWLYSLGVLLPSLAVTARRLHDTGRTAWWLLLLLVPVIGWIALLVMAIIPGTRGGNRYGPDPLGIDTQGRGAGMGGGYGYQDPGHPYAPPPDAYGASGSAPPRYTPGARQYCPQCGAERAAADARFCTVCGAEF